MPTANPPKTITWGPDSQAALDDWFARAKALGLPVTYQRMGVRVDSDSAAIREALKHAAGCRCEEHKAHASEEARYRREDNAAARAEIDRILEPSNPLRGLRVAAGLNQREAAARLGITRGALATAEARAACSPEYVERARKAWGR